MSAGSSVIAYSMVLLVFCLATPVVEAQSPGTISYQGYLTDASGTAVDDTLTIIFTFYDSLGASVWSETQPDVVVVEGVFAVRLGSVTPFGRIFYQPLVVGVSVGGDPEMTPMTPLDSVPYSESVTCEQFSLATCSSGCVDLTTDESNCGSCDQACAVGGFCTSGVCLCPADLETCGGSCVDQSNDVSHCGACDAACAGGESCCTGSCADLSTDASNCGSCGNACASAPATCDSPSLCQGSRLVASCTAGSCDGPEEIDVACHASLLANDCGPYPDVYCTGLPFQTPPECATSCTVDADCDGDAFCFGEPLVCNFKMSAGQPCLTNNWCLSDSCVGGFCN